MIDEQSSASGHDYASDRSAIGTGSSDVMTNLRKNTCIIALGSLQLSVQVKLYNSFIGLVIISID